MGSHAGHSTNRERSWAVRTRLCSLAGGERKAESVRLRLQATNPPTYLHARCGANAVCKQPAVEG